MGNNSFDDRKVKSNDIVNGVARKDIYNQKGLLLVKEGTRIREAHYSQMRADGLIQEEVETASKISAAQKLDINYVSPTSVHGRLDKLMTKLSHLQDSLVEDDLSGAKDEVIFIASTFIELCQQNIYQVLGELYLSGTRKINYVKPMYIAASMIELIKRYNRFKEQEVVSPALQNDLVIGALLYNIGFLINSKMIGTGTEKLTIEQKRDLKAHYQGKSIEMMQKLGFTNPAVLTALKNHHLKSTESTLETSLLRTPYLYANISMLEFNPVHTDTVLNPCKQFAQLFAKKELDPVMGGLFLKINGLFPVGSIVLFSSREKALVIKGPADDNISSSTLRLLTNRSGIQLRRPGDKFLLNRTKLEQKGLSDHHQFAWSLFSPFTMWER